MWVVVGCGYVGERLGPARATTRRPERAAELRARGIDAVVVDPGDPAGMARALDGATVVVNSVPVGAGAAVRAAAPSARVIYLSSTGVYERSADGAWVDEQAPVRAGAPRLADEAAADVVLRIAAIYGPGRGVHERMRAGTYRVIGDGALWTSRVHVDDLVAVIRAAAARGSGVYNVADDEPTSARAHADAVAAALGLPAPPSVPLSSVAPEVAEMFLGNRRIANDRMKRELGVTLRFPSWRDGLQALPGR
jgi:nucleoside-diphosphate-sugar epimerase